MADRKYRLGEYEFDTYEEYLDGEEDLKKIEIITGELDITDVDVAAALYTKIRNKEVVFKGKVGVNFFMNLADIVVNHSVALADEKRATEAKREKNKKASKGYIFAGAGCIVAALICLVIFSVIDYQNGQSEQLYATLRDTKNMTGAVVGEDDLSSDAVVSGLPEIKKPDPIVENTEEQSEKQEETQTLIDPSTLKILPELETLHDQNKDMVGWLTIQGTNIDYPVMMSEEDNGQFYLKHNFYKESDGNGSLFMDYRNDFVNRDTNIIIYGHNMKSGAMFGTLKNFESESFLNEHKTIRFDTLYEKGTYEIIGVYRDVVHKDTDYAFRYYDFLTVKNEAEYDAFKVNVTQLDVHGRGNIDTNYGDKLLTLSTCSSYIEDGRLFVVAKKIE